MSTEFVPLVVCEFLCLRVTPVDQTWLEQIFVAHPPTPGPEGSETIRCHGVSNGKSPAILGYGSQTSKRKHRRKKTLSPVDSAIQ